jgi:ABC-type cobalamin transport system permease subunit
MFQYISRSSVVAAWCVMLVAAVWIASAKAPVAATAVMAIIGLVPVMVLIVFARRPEQTMAEVLRPVEDESA